MENNSLDNLIVYQKAVGFSDKAWEVLKQVPMGYRYSTGEQFIESADSVGANLAEGYGRFTYKQRIQFCRYSRGSLYEARYWFNRISKRFEIDNKTMEEFNSQIKNLGYLINQYIRYLKSQDKNQST